MVLVKITWRSGHRKQNVTNASSDSDGDVALLLVVDTDFHWLVHFRIARLPPYKPDRTQQEGKRCLGFRFRVQVTHRLKSSSFFEVLNRTTRRNYNGAYGYRL